MSTTGGKKEDNTEISIAFPSKRQIVENSDMNGSDMIFMSVSHYQSHGIPKVILYLLYLFIFVIS